MNGIYYAIFSQIHYLSLLSNPTRSESGTMKMIIICATAQAPLGITIGITRAQAAEKEKHGCWN